MNSIDDTIKQAKALGMKVDPMTRTMKALTQDDFRRWTDDEIEQAGALLAELAFAGYTERGTEH